jgi:aromatic-L-amino-acid/L-tryptophan decarboxylase
VAEHGYHMSPQEFRRHGHAVVDWVAAYLEHVEELPVRSRVAPGDIRAKLPERPPELPEPFEAMLTDVEEIVLPGITHWQSPGFYAYFPCNSSGPAILGELLSAGFGVQGMLWSTSPACTELETLVLDWLVELLGLPERFRSTTEGAGVIQDSGSSATLVALLAARERARDAAGPLVFYASTQAHSSVEKGLRIAGLGADSLRLVEVDEAYALRPDLLDEAMAADRAAGRVPCAVVATVGTTSSLAIDPLRPIGEICRRHGAWLHVDAAMGGTAAVCPELRWIQDGLELADSYVFDPHKWMFTNFDCSAFWVADRATLIRTLSVLPEYLRNPASETGAVIDYRDWHVPLGRRFRALKLWFTIRHYGAEGLRHHVREHVALAAELAGWVRDDPRFELAAPVRLPLVCFRHNGGDEAGERLLERVNESGEAFLTHTRLGGRYTLRMSVAGTATRREHLERTWELIGRLADQPA